MEMSQQLSPPNPTQMAWEAYKLLREATNYMKSMNDDGELNEMVAALSDAMGAADKAYIETLKWEW